MTLMLIAVIFGLISSGVEIRANARFQQEDRLPMQWWVDGSVTWSAPRQVALSFIPILATVTLCGLASLLSHTNPRPGQEHLAIPSLFVVALIFLGVQIFHLWMVGKTIGRNKL